MKAIANVLEDAEINMNVDNWGGCGRGKIVKIPSVGNFWYNRSNKVSNILIYSRHFRGSFFQCRMYQIIKCNKLMSLHCLNLW